MSARIVFLSFVMTALAASAASAQTGFIKKEHSDGAKYQIFVPHDYKDDKAYPIILFLHGLGESGPMAKSKFRSASAKQSRSRKDISLPRRPPTIAKANLEGRQRRRQTRPRHLRRNLQNLQGGRKTRIPDGLSMGGFGTWSMVAAYPDRWAAIAPICGGGDVKPPPRSKMSLVGTSTAKTTPRSKSNNPQDDPSPQRRRRQPPLYRISGVGHNSWDAAYGTAELYTWLLENKRK